MFRFEKLEVWKESILYTKNIYKIAKSFPRSEQFALTSQLKRASISISSNIAEGSGSSSLKDFSNYLDIAIKSTIETVSQLFLAVELKYIKEEVLKPVYNEAEILVKRIQGLKKYLRKSRKTNYE